MCCVLDVTRICMVPSVVCIADDTDHAHIDRAEGAKAPLQTFGPLFEV